MTALPTTPTTGSPSLNAMAGIEARRVARNPFLVAATVFAFGLLLWQGADGTSDRPPGDLLSWPVIPAFFVGLTSLVVLARQTRSTEAAAEAMNAAPGTEARRTLALALACLVPALVGLVFVLAEVAIMTWWHDPTAQEWWFGTMSDAQVWAILLALGPVACLGGGLLGVLVGRWLHFPGAAAVVVVALVVLDLLGQGPVVESHADARLWVPWAMFQSGTNSDGTADLYGGNAVFYLVYALCLCAAAVLAAVWHDRRARTSRLKAVFAATVVVGLVALTLSMTTGTTETRTSDPVPWQVG